jgi:hypothetical protein
LEGRLAGQLTLYENDKTIANAAEQAMANYSFSQTKGNQSEPETLEYILKRLKVNASLGLVNSQPMIVMDRVIATKDSLTLIKEMEFPYNVVERRAVEKEYFDETRRILI